jgi:catechol 2,3-dioxygenase-like lactoylglutathione lyase family enzyme
MTMASYQRAVPVLQVASVEKSVRWYADVLGFAANPFPKSPPYSFAILRRDGAEIMAPVRRRDGHRGLGDAPGRSGVSLVDLPSDRGSRDPRRRRRGREEGAAAAGPERMVYGLAEFELCDPDGYRVCVSGEAPAGTTVKAREE